MDRVPSRSAIGRPQIAITVRYDGTTAHIALTGELDLAVIDDVRDIVKLVVTRDGLTAMQMDVARVTFIDSTGLMILIGARRVAHDYLLTFTLTAAHNGPVARLITMCGVRPLVCRNSSRTGLTPGQRRTSCTRPGRRPTRRHIDAAT